MYVLAFTSLASTSCIVRLSRGFTIWLLKHVQGYTKAYVDGNIDGAAEWDRIERSYEKVSSTNDFTIVEGTGHVGVGSIVGMSNAAVAQRLGLPVVLVGTGGLGSTYDELALNKQVCDNLGVSFCLNVRRYVSRVQEAQSTKKGTLIRRTSVQSFFLTLSA